MSRFYRENLETETMEEEIQCPYCLKTTDVEPAPDYEPIYARCAVCGKRFILERVIDGIQALKVEGAPVCSDPDRREIEMGAGQED
jgi:DNA-directed RNA polymerase subunit RPC12/RpoP